MGSIEMDGFEELEELLHDMTVTESDEKKAMKKAIRVISKEIEKNTAVLSGYTKKQIKESVKKEDFATVGEVRMGAWYTSFEEFGTSQQKHNVGFFERSVNRSQNEAIQTIGKELLGKIK